jgi:hypothetical protein
MKNKLKTLNFKKLRCVKKFLGLINSPDSPRYSLYGPEVSYKISNCSGYICLYGEDPYQDKYVKL